jgi:fumarate hydratase class II
LAHREGLTLKAAALQRGIATESQFDDWINPEAMTKPLSV